MVEAGSHSAVAARTSCFTLPKYQVLTKNFWSRSQDVQQVDHCCRYFFSRLGQGLFSGRTRAALFTASIFVLSRRSPPPNATTRKNRVDVNGESLHPRICVYRPCMTRKVRGVSSSSMLGGWVCMHQQGSRSHEDRFVRWGARTKCVRPAAVLVLRRKRLSICRPTSRNSIFVFEVFSSKNGRIRSKSSQKQSICWTHIKMRSR